MFKKTILGGRVVIIVTLKFGLEWKYSEQKLLIF